MTPQPQEPAGQGFAESWKPADLRRERGNPQPNYSLKSGNLQVEGRLQDRKMTAVPGWCGAARTTWKVHYRKPANSAPVQCRSVALPGPVGRLYIKWRLLDPWRGRRSVLGHLGLPRTTRRLGVRGGSGLSVGPSGTSKSRQIIVHRAEHLFTPVTEGGAEGKSAKIKMKYHARSPRFKIQAN
ncbi:hypothetical protein E2C01_035295 [Portunus trituberculatus]|uniref:Uncharacterized protein n=1 Tax=Portunus trituberculatus TaxID=210409 RepID=A0A5B7F7Y9_PORTR|nr:hypothetical protein [Portunus trituberculatus]